MSVKISFEFGNVHHASEFLQKMAPNTVASEVKKPEEGAAPAKTEAPAPRRRGRPLKAAAPDKQETPAAVSPAPVAADRGAAEKALEEVFDAKGINVARDLLSRYGVKRLTEMLPEHYPKFVEYAKQVLAGEAV